MRAEWRLDCATRMDDDFRRTVQRRRNEEKRSDVGVLAWTKLGLGGILASSKVETVGSGLNGREKRKRRKKNRGGGRGSEKKRRRRVVGRLGLRHGERREEKEKEKKNNG
ncbi:hypothetical protein Csa_019981, partial [Cucumis sativus]